MTSARMPQWHRYEGPFDAQCIEVAHVPGPLGGVLIRTQSRVIIATDHATWQAFVQGVKAGDLDAWTAPEPTPALSTS